MMTEVAILEEFCFNISMQQHAKLLPETVKSIFKISILLYTEHSPLNTVGLAETSTWKVTHSSIGFTSQC